MIRTNDDLERALTSPDRIDPREFVQLAECHVQAQHALRMTGHPGSFAATMTIGEALEKRLAEFEPVEAIDGEASGELDSLRVLLAEVHSLWNLYCATGGRWTQALGEARELALLLASSAGTLAATMGATEE